MDGIGEMNHLHDDLDEDNAEEDIVSGEVSPLHDNTDGDNAIVQYANVDDDVDLDVIRVPRAGMEFKSVDEAFEYYKDYGNQIGFPVLKRSGTNYSKGRLRYEIFTCARGGKPHGKDKTSLRNRLSTKTNCKARIRLKVYDDGMVVVNSVVLEHNHDLNPSQARYFRRNRKSGSPIRKKLVLVDEAEIYPEKNCKTSVLKRCGHENSLFLENDRWSFAEKASGLFVGAGFDETICNYLSRMQKRNSNFFYATDLDDENHVRNIFWADARSRAAYLSFGDIVALDTTCLSDKYDVPLATFIGVNHHGQSILFGCAVLSNKDHRTFEWLFRQWFICMSEKAPDAIITDQDKAIKGAIQTVFPNVTRHRWCLWNIMKRIPEKLTSYSQQDAIKADLENVVYDSENRSEFETKWAVMLERYSLGSNKWLDSLYSNRDRWAPIFVKDSFWAGMSTTQRTETITTFFVGYINPRTSLKQFFEQYGNALRSKVEKESYEDYGSCNMVPLCVTEFEMEKEFQKVYTNAKFFEVQQEFKGIMYCNVTLVQRVGAVSIYDVSEKIWGGQTANTKRVTYIVYFNEEEVDVKCSCYLFEFRGILCRHAIRVLDHNEIDSVPTKFILSRWRKDIKRDYMKVKVTYVDLNDTLEMQRYDHIIQKAHEVARLGSASEIKEQLVLDCMDELIKKLS